MSVTVTILWHDGGKTDVQAPTYGQAIDKADSMGALNLRTGMGERLLKLSGEWVYLPNESR